MTPLTFPSDPLVWAQKRRNQWVFLLFLLLPVFGCLLFSPFALVPGSRTLTAAAIPVFLVVWALQRNPRYRVFDVAREPHIRLTGEHLASVREGSTTTLAFNDLKRLIIWQNRQGVVYKIVARTAKQTITLDGFQEMDRLAAAVVNQAPATCQIRYRRNWFYELYPWRWWLLTALFVGLFLWWQMYIYNSAWLIATPLALYILYRYLKSLSLKGKLIFGLAIFLLNLMDVVEWVDNADWNAAAFGQ